MSQETEDRLIMMVAQAPFEVADMNQFCKLLPVVYVDGRTVSPAEFPNDGEIWWMLTATTSRLAIPGQLVVGGIESAVRFDINDNESSRVQAQRESVQEICLRDGFGIISIETEVIGGIQDVVERGFSLTLPVPPARVSMVQWNGYYYGPFTVSSISSVAAKTGRAYALAPGSADHLSIYQVDQTTFESATKGHRVKVREKVSTADSPRLRGIGLIDIRHDLVLAGGYQAILAANPRKLLLEPLERKLLAFAKDCLTRAKRQQLKQLLDEMVLTGRESSAAQDLLAVIGRVRGVVEQQEAAFAAVAEAMLKSGLFGPERIAKAEQAFADKYVQARTAELQAVAEQGLATKREELRIADAELQQARNNVNQLKQERLLQLEKEMASEKMKILGQLSAGRVALEADQEEFGKQKEELKRQQGLLQLNLEKVTKELREAGDEVVNRFLTIAPLLRAVGPEAKSGGLSSPAPEPATPAASALPVPFVFPNYIDRKPERSGVLGETEFFERFRGVVEKSGFVFRPLDLQRYHLSVKCGELTVLGGPSGTGKSSLPALYSQALLGNEGPLGRPGCLMVNVNPSWMDTRDLLGHMNTLDGRFYPTESGLYQHLLVAQKEHELKGTASGIYLACLDEMNLSQVEHYFSDFMMVLERSGAARAIQCFSPETAGPNCQFREWGSIRLSPALRFVGTVNFDETTRLLSDRFLDRVNLIRLTSAGLPDATGAGVTFAATGGPMVTLADFDSWRSDKALPAHLGQLLDQMRPLLGQMDCPISPRVYRAICRFVSSAAPVMSQEKAFEVQVAQRIVPRIRSLVTARQLDGLDKLMQLLTQSSACSFEESMPLLEELKEGESGRNWELEV